MYLIFNKENKRQFKLVPDYIPEPIDSTWDAAIVSGNQNSRGEEVATKPKAGALTVKPSELQRRGL